MQCSTSVLRCARDTNSEPAMITIFGIPSAVLFGQLLIGLINGSFYALLSLGLAVIFGMLNIINFTHGAQYMLGAVVAYLMLQFLGIGYWPALILSPILVGITGILIERMVLQWVYKLGQHYGLLLTYGVAVALAAFAGVMAAPIYNVSPNMGSELIIVVFAVVVIGGMGSILGAILSGFGLGIIEGLTKVFYPEASNTVIFVVMAVVLLVRPAGLFGRRS